MGRDVRWAQPEMGTAHFNTSHGMSDCPPVSSCDGRIGAASRAIRMAQPLLHLGDVRLIGERICGRRRPHRAYTEAHGFSCNACRLCILHDDVAVDGTRITVPVQRSSPVICHRPEQRFVDAAMFLPPAVFPHL